MAKYQAEPFYNIKLVDSQLEFDHNGFYETNNPKEIKELDKMVPAWITCIEETKTEPKQKAEDKPAPKKAPARKPSAK